MILFVALYGGVTSLWSVLLIRKLFSIQRRHGLDSDRGNAVRTRAEPVDLAR